MATDLHPIEKEIVPLTAFHNHTGRYLDLGRRSPVTITKHGRPDLTISDAAYFERLERIAAGQIRGVLDLQVVETSQMSADHAAIFAAAKPTADEIAEDRWDNDAAA